MVQPIAQQRKNADVQRLKVEVEKLPIGIRRMLSRQASTDVAAESGSGVMSSGKADSKITQ